jgi:hypothetical protein
LRVEIAIAQFLDSFYYPKVTKSFKRISDRSEQFKGRDVEIEDLQPGLKVIDEKATVHYINRDIPTFAFEISYIGSKGDVKEGWLFDEKKETDHYLLIWPFARTSINPAFNDFVKLRLMMLSRRRLIEHLDASGFTRTYCSRRGDEIRASKTGGVFDRDKNGLIYFFFTKELQEQPINLVVNRSILNDICEEHQIITPLSISDC